MRVSAGVREDKDPADSLPACATCISSRRSRCAQIRAESVAAHCRALLAARNEEAADGRGGEDGRERQRAGGEEVAARTGVKEKVVRRRTRDERPQSTQHRLAKIAWNTPGIYYPHGCSATARRPPLGQGVAHSGTEEEKRAREEPHDRPRCIARRDERERPPRIVSTVCP